MTSSKGSAATETYINADQNLYDVRKFIDSDLPKTFDPIGLVTRLLRGRWHIACFLVLISCSVFGVLGYSAISPKFESQGMIRISAKESPLLYADANDSRLKLFDAFVSGEVKYLGSRPVLERALSDLNASDSTQTKTPGSVSDLSGMISISRSKGLILLSARSGDPASASVVVNAIIDAYLSLYTEQQKSRQIYRERELVTRERELLAQLETTKVKILEAGGEYSTDSLLKSHIAKVAQIQEREGQIDELVGTIAQLETVGAASAADTGDLEIKRATLLDRALADMTYDRAKRSAALEAMRQRYTPKNPIIRKAESEIAVLEEAIEQRREQITTLGRTGALTSAGTGNRSQSIDELKALLKKLEQRQSILRDEAKLLNSKMVELRFLAEERTGIRVLLDETRRVLDRVRVESRNSLPGVVEVLTYGGQSTVPAEDKRAQIAILFAGMGGALAILTMIGTIFLRNTAKFSDDLETLDAIAPVLAALPQTDDLTSDQFMSSIHKLRNAIQLLQTDDREFETHSRVVAVTSEEDSRGVTSLTHILGRGFAEGGLNTVVVDGDMVGHGLTNQFEAVQEFGWRDLLAGGSLVNVSTEIVDGVRLVPVGVARNIHDWGTSLPRLRTALASLTAKYDLVVIDLGAAESRLSSSLVASQADLTIVVSRPGESLSRLRTLLSKLNRISTGKVFQVFNFAHERDPGLAGRKRPVLSNDTKLR